MTRRAAGAGLLVLASLALVVVGAGPGTAATAGAPSGPALDVAPGVAPGGPVTIRLGRVSPSGLDATHALVVKGSLRNPGAAIAGATLRLRLNRVMLDTRAKIDSWMVNDGDATSGVEALGSGRLLPGGHKLIVPARSTVPFTLTVPAGGTDLEDGSWAFGPRGLTVQLASGTTELASLRTLIVWAPASRTIPATRLSMLVPMTSVEPSADAGLPSQSSADLLASEGRLQRTIDAASDPAFDWAIDPAMLQAAQALSETGVIRATEDSQTGQAGATGSETTSSSSSSGSPPSGSARSTPESPQQQQSADALAWLAKVKQGLNQRVVLGLPYADTDLNSVLNNGQSPLLRTADQLGKQVTHSVLGVKLDRTVAWPGDGKISGKAVAGLSRAGRTDVLLAAGNQPPVQDLTYTPTGRSTMRAKNHQLGGLLYDEQLSALFTASGGTTSAVSTQWMLAELAAIGMERPSQITHVLAVAPRNWDPEPSRVQAFSAALRSAPWVDLEDLNTLRQEDPRGTDRGEPVYSGPARLVELPAGQILSIARLNDGLALFAPVAVDPEPRLSELREQIASLLSVGWRGRDDELYSARLQVSRLVNPVANGVLLLPGSRSKWFTAQSSSISVYVQNDTPFTIKVKVKLTPKSGQLRFQDAAPIDVTPKTRRPIMIKTRAIAGGDVNVEATLLTPEGQQLGRVAMFKVHVRPTWEKVGMIGAGSVLGLLFIIGLIRSIRRDRPRVPPESVPDVDDLAARASKGPEASAEAEPEPEPPAADTKPTGPEHALATKEKG